MIRTSRSKRLAQLMNYAYKNVPYYFENIGKMPQRLEDFPVISKAILRKEFDRFISKEFNINDLIIEYTSGTTGIPLKCAKTKNEMLKSSKYAWKWRTEWLGVDAFSNMLTITQTHSSMGALEKYEVKRTSLFGDFDCKYISIDDINDRSSDELLDFIMTIKPIWIMSTPSALLDLIARLKKSLKWNDNCLNSVKLVEFMSEMIYPEQRKEIQDIFDCKTTSIYGTRECWPISAECEFGNLHVFEDHVFCELVNEEKYDGNGVGEITITTLGQYAMPLIRYNLEDIGELKTMECKCGKSGLVISNLQGRISQTFIVDGKKFSTKVFSLMIEDVINKKLFDVQKYKVTQFEEKVFEVVMQGKESEKYGYAEYINEYMKKQISDDLSIVVKTADILKNEKEKWMPFCSKVDN